MPWLDVERNVAFAARDARERERVRDAIDRVGLSGAARVLPKALSGGLAQRAALARTLVRGPRVLLLDEPLSALDARTRARAATELGGSLREIDVPTVLVTHDFAEAAHLGDQVAIIDRGRIMQRGTASELAAAPGSAFVADFTGAVVLTGTARSGPDGLTVVALDGGGTVWALDSAHGPVAVSVYPWEIVIEPAGAERTGSAQNQLAVDILSVTSVGNRVRLGLASPQPLAAEITETASRELKLAAGMRVIASWKAAATRLLDL